jgi:LPS sulfotransferase NodH
MSTKFVIVGAPRTGSTLLVKTLNTLEGVRCHGELLGAEQVRGYEDGFDLEHASKAARDARSQRFLAERNADPVGFIARTLNTSDTIVGFKALYSAFLNPRWRDVIAYLQGVDDIRFIHLVRANDLRRFISEQILLQGGPNHSGAGGRSETPIKVHIDIDTFLQRSAELTEQANELNAALSDQSVLNISYEELSADTTATVNRVAAFLELESTPAAVKPALQKVGAADLRDSVSNYQDLLNHPATRPLALAD